MSLAKLLGQKIKEKVDGALAGKYKTLLKESIEGTKVP